MDKKNKEIFIKPETNEDIESKDIVAQDLPKLLDIINNKLNVIADWGLVLDQLDNPPEPEKEFYLSNNEIGFDEISDRIIFNVSQKYKKVLDLLGLGLRIVPLKHLRMTTAGEHTIQPGTMVIDCTNPVKLIDFLDSVESPDLKESSLESSLKNLGIKFYDQTCYIFDLEDLTGDEITLIGNIPNIAEHLNRLGLISDTKNLVHCSKALKERYLKEYSNLANQGIFLNDISKRYLDRGESGWYDTDWKKVIGILFESWKNPNARSFIQETANNLLTKAKDSRAFFEAYPRGEDGKLFAMMALKTLNEIIPDLEKLLLD